MKLAYKGLLLAVLHLAIVCSLGAKLLYDRAHRPRVWIQVASADPNLPIRGRYLALNLQVPADGFSTRTETYPWQGGNAVPHEVSFPNRCDLVLRRGQLIAVANENGEYWVSVRQNPNGPTAFVSGETVYFLPEHAANPWQSAKGELWIEATIPRKGPPRPIRLGVKKDGVLTPLPGE